MHMPAGPFLTHEAVQPTKLERHGFRFASLHCRYLDGQVGAAKDAVWSDLNGEVGDVLMKRLANRSALIAARRQSPLGKQARPSLQAS